MTDLGTNMTDEVVVTKAGGGWYEVKASWEDEAHKVQGAEPAEELKVELMAHRAVDLQPKVATQVINDEPEKSDIDFAANMRAQAKSPKEYTGTMNASAKKAAGMPATTRIILEENEEIPPTGLYLGVNGRGYMIVAGEPVDVPNFLLDVLDNAIMSQPVRDPRTQKVVGYRDRMRYSYRKVS